MIPLVLISITCAALWWYGPDNWRRRYGWAMAGQLAKTFVLMLFFFYYVWKARRLNNMYCDALQVCVCVCVCVWRSWPRCGWVGYHDMAAD